MTTIQLLSNKLSPESRTHVTEFVEFRGALRRWVNDALTRLSSQGEAYENITEGPHWICNSDGTFEERETNAQTWNTSMVQYLLRLPSWTAVHETISKPRISQIILSVDPGVPGHLLPQGLRRQGR
jgi:hypothetical protein